MVPGLVLGRAATRHRLVPFLGSLEGGVDVDDDAPVIKQLVMDWLADVKPRA
jgi:hypothetical protein